MMLNFSINLLEWAINCHLIIDICLSSILFSGEKYQSKKIYSKNRTELFLYKSFFKQNMGSTFVYVLTVKGYRQYKIMPEIFAFLK